MKFHTTTPPTAESRMTDHPNDDTFTKHDQHKPKMHLVPSRAYRGVAEVMTYGAEKYDDENWRKVDVRSRYFSAALRHLREWWEGANIDEESGLSTLDHAVANVMMLSELCKLSLAKDDRPKFEPVQLSDEAKDRLTWLAAKRISTDGFVANKAFPVLPVGEDKTLRVGDYVMSSLGNGPYRIRKLVDNTALLVPVKKEPTEKEPQLVWWHQDSLRLCDIDDIFQFPVWGGTEFKPGDKVRLEGDADGPYTIQERADEEGFDWFTIRPDGLETRCQLVNEDEITPWAEPVEEKTERDPLQKGNMVAYLNDGPYHVKDTHTFLKDLPPAVLLVRCTASGTTKADDVGFWVCGDDLEDVCLWENRDTTEGEDERAALVFLDQVVTLRGGDERFRCLNVSDGQAFLWHYRANKTRGGAWFDLSEVELVQNATREEEPA